ncbi:MAG TPA: hypothetical protein VE646_05865 [Actinomycetota bacterium]|nr:hypothetical protein [Actinomycetota bacterium]
MPCRIHATAELAFLETESEYVHRYKILKELLSDAESGGGVAHAA